VFLNAHSETEELCK